MVAKLFPRIVVPSDGSDQSMTAIGPAAQLARLAGVTLTLFGVVEKQHDRAAFTALIEQHPAARAAVVPLDVGVAVAGPLVGDGNFVADAIIDEAGNDGALICIASHGRGGVATALLGSVTQQILRTVNGPVLVVGPQVVAVEIDERTLVVGVDGSPFAEHIVPFASSWSAAFGLPLRFVQIADTATWKPGRHGHPGEDAADYLAKLAARHLDSTFEVMQGRFPAHELAGLTERWDVGLLALTTHGRTGLGRLALGSVAMTVLHRAQCPVLLVRPPDLEKSAESGGEEGT